MVSSTTPTMMMSEVPPKNIKNGTELGKKAKTYMDQGLLVPDELVVAPHPTHARLPPMRLIIFSSGTSTLMAKSTFSPSFSKAASRLSACGMVRGKPSSTYPFWQSLCCTRSTTRSTTSSSGTYRIKAYDSMIKEGRML